MSDDDLLDDLTGAPEEIVPDYSRVGFRDLRKLCTARGIPADGTVVQLIEKLKAWDAEHGRAIDLTVPDIDDDLLDDNPARDVTNQATEQPGTDNPARDHDTPEPSTAHALVAPVPARPSEAPTGGGEAASAPPPGGLPSGIDERGRVTLTTRTGVVRIGEDHHGQAVCAYRVEYPIGRHDVTDDDHFRMIEDTHRAAKAAGYATKGGIGIGQRMGYAADDNGQRTVIYQVPLKRQQ